MAVPTFLSKNWPPRCIEIVAPNSTVLHKELLEELCDVLQLRGQRLDKSKLRSIIRALDRYYQVRGRAAFLSHVRKSTFGVQSYLEQKAWIVCSVEALSHDVFGQWST